MRKPIGGMSIMIMLGAAVCLASAALPQLPKPTDKAPRLIICVTKKCAVTSIKVVGQKVDLEEGDLLPAIGIGTVPTLIDVDGDTCGVPTEGAFAIYSRVENPNNLLFQPRDIEVIAAPSKPKLNPSFHTMDEVEQFLKDIKDNPLLLERVRRALAPKGGPTGGSN